MAGEDIMNRSTITPMPPISTLQGRVLVAHSAESTFRPRSSSMWKRDLTVACLTLVAVWFSYMAVAYIKTL